MFCLDPDLGIHSNYLDIQKQENVKQSQNVIKYSIVNVKTQDEDGLY